VNTKWHFKIKHSNVKTAATSLAGQLTNRSSISKKALTPLSDVRIVEQKLVQTSTMEADTTVVDNVNLSRLLVLTVAQKIQYLSSREAINRYFVEIVSEKANKANNTLN